MDVVNLLSESNSKKLIELANELKELSEKEFELVSQSNELIKKGDEAEKNKSDLNNIGKKYIIEESGEPKVNINNLNDSDGFINLVTGSDDYKLEEKNIEEESSLICSELDKINESRNIIKEKINQILSMSAKKDKGINVSDLGTMYIINAKITEDRDKVSKDLCEIINCQRSLLKEIGNLYSANSTEILDDSKEDTYTKLKKYVENYNNNKSKNDIQLEILNKTEESKEEQVVEIPVKEVENEVTKEPVVENVVPDNIVSIDVPKVEEPIAVIKDPVTLEVISEIRPNTEEIQNEVDNKSSDNIVPLSEIMGDTKKDEAGKILYIVASDKITPNQIARATKDKLYNKIILIFKGSYPETKVVSVNSLNENKVNENFSMENFVSNIAA